jgi:pimeloyl-ACP methyl ester carboxylesterase
VAYDPQQLYRGVVAQQGRVTLEADWNEQLQTAAEEQRAELQDIVGSSGTPDDGYAISAAPGPSPSPAYDIVISKGTMYVGGVRAHLATDAKCSAQADPSVQTPDALVDWLEAEAPSEAVGVIGWGDGGMIALYAAALDPRIRASCVSGYFSDRRSIWQQPIDRNVFGLLDQFGDAELARLTIPSDLTPVVLPPLPRRKMPAAVTQSEVAPAEIKNNADPRAMRDLLQPSSPSNVVLSRPEPGSSALAAAGNSDQRSAVTPATKGAAALVP